MNLPELSACPFCGHKAELRVPQKGYGLPFVACTHCSCEIGARATTEVQAIKRWNTRSGQLVASTDALVPRDAVALRDAFDAGYEAGIDAAEPGGPIAYRDNREEEWAAFSALAAIKGGGDADG